MAWQYKNSSLSKGSLFWKDFTCHHISAHLICITLKPVTIGSKNSICKINAFSWVHIYHPGLGGGTKLSASWDMLERYPRGLPKREELIGPFGLNFKGRHLWYFLPLIPPCPFMYFKSHFQCSWLINTSKIAWTS